MATEKFSNLAITQLNGSLDNSTTSVVVQSASLFPTTGNFRIVVDSEIMLVTNVSSNTFTVTRGAESTSAVSHANGATVSHVYTAGALNQQRAETIATGAIGSLPTAEINGRLYLPNDSPYPARDTGSVWSYWGPIYPFTTPPTSGNWTWVNQGSATVTQQGHVVYLRDPGTASRNGRLLVRTIPSAPYTVSAAIVPFTYTSSSGNPPEAGLVLYDNVSGKTIYLTHIDFQTSSRIGYYKQNSVTSFNSEYGTALYNNLLTNVLFLRFVDNSTNRLAYWSADGVNWEQVQSSVANTDWLTPTHIGFFVDCNSCNSPISSSLLSWSVT